MDSQYKLLSELLSDQAAFITSPKTSLANYWGVLPPCPPSVYGPEFPILCVRENSEMWWMLVCDVRFSCLII